MREKGRICRRRRNDIISEVCDGIEKIRKRRGKQRRKDTKEI